MNNDLESLRLSVGGNRIYPAFNEFADQTDETYTKPTPFVDEHQASRVYEDVSAVIHKHTRYFNEHGEMEAAIQVSGGDLDLHWINLRDFLYNRPDE
jgi:hypothetical protein